VESQARPAVRLVARERRVERLRPAIAADVLRDVVASGLRIRAGDSCHHPDDSSGSSDVGGAHGRCRAHLLGSAVHVERKQEAFDCDPTRR